VVCYWGNLLTDILRYWLIDSTIILRIKDAQI
jgi:hypothetical protein